MPAELLHPLPKTPPLENGDRLSRSEFERRYDASANVKKAELIEGIVHVPSSVRARSHAQPHGVVSAWLGIYSAHTPHTSALDNATVPLDLDNEPQPDALLRIDAAAGGQSRLSADDYVEGAPELAVEVAASSATYDLHAKLNVYRRNGMSEYVVWRVLDGAVDWFILEDGEYRPLAPDSTGVVEARASPACAWPWARSWPAKSRPCSPNCSAGWIRQHTRRSSPSWRRCGAESAWSNELAA